MIRRIGERLLADGTLQPLDLSMEIGIDSFAAAYDPSLALIGDADEVADKIVRRQLPEATTQVAST